jgi:putative flippase GtrA
MSSDSLPFESTQRAGLIRRISIRFGGSRPKELERFLKFAVVGAIGAIIDLGLTNFMMKFVFHVHPDDVVPVLISAAVGFTAAVSSNFIWNRFWTYPDSRSRQLVKQLGQFFVVNAVGLGIRAVVIGSLYGFFNAIIEQFFRKVLSGVTLTPDNQARIAANMATIVALVVVMFWNFFANRYWTYNDVD